MQKFLLLLLISISFTLSKAQDSLLVRIKIEELEKTPVVLSYSDSSQYKSANPIEEAHNEYLYKLPNNGYTMVQFLVNNSKNLLMTESGFTPKPMSKALASPHDITSITVKNGDQFDIEVTSKDKEVNLFEKYAEKERAYYRSAWNALTNKNEGIDNATQADAASFEKEKEVFVEKIKTLTLRLPYFLLTIQDSLR